MSYETDLAEVLRLLDALETACEGIEEENACIDFSNAARNFFMAHAKRLASLEQPRVVPEGYVLVPRQPTEEMIKVAYNHTLELYDFMDPGLYASLYKAMIESAPPPHGETP